MKNGYRTTIGVAVLIASLGASATFTASRAGGGAGGGGSYGLGGTAAGGGPIGAGCCDAAVAAARAEAARVDAARVDAARGEAAIDGAGHGRGGSRFDGRDDGAERRVGHASLACNRSRRLAGHCHRYHG